MMRIQSIAATEKKSDHAKHLQVKQENGRIHPAIGDVFQFRVFDLLFLIHNGLIARQK
jgi:hypothetical protein